jgi:hypothetical protein
MELLFAALLCLQGEKITLQWNPKEGDKLSVVDKKSFSVNVTADVKGKQTEVTFERRNTDKIEREFLKVEGAKVVKESRRYEESIEEQKRTGKADWERKEKPVHGKTLALELKEGKVVVEGAENAPEKWKRKLSMDDLFARALPKRPVAVGDSWEVAGKELQTLMEGDSGVEGGLKMKLAAIREIDGRRCAIVEASLDLKGKTEKGIETGAKLSGEIAVWIERGYTLKADLKGTMTMSGSAGGGSMNGEGPMTIEVSTTIR